ncbi:MAG: PQQ-binding-like beta-propeller repeat protein [Candidatus Eisenbacteria bacterium]|uniref:PQQ-binding-like beta-propeller repeat protein n=1 Tax=Eiseniibacteriota bacterium TaxID=2212470 RepID=A0A948RVT5_UNCEI|nr:PQQ-binding-like beta-propeller repeat protein [Candidatus Eisenbacteria bacterium]MBU1949684.1 PQQ-binding-like beta-propeller repeat protein [Candidatus Eisenbacteria bacterium]MBU2691955.1 PQQ-binding-like beta-propeller repeat protein [Candidatus Eisenbacteria bacterium]
MKRNSFVQYKMTMILFGVALLLLFSATAAQGVSTYWQAATGDWYNHSNWTDGIPSSGDEAFINNGGTALIGSQVGSTRDLTLGAGIGESGTVEMNGGSLIVEEYLYIGDSGTGLLSIENGAALSESEAITGVFIGYRENGEGSVVVSGPGSIWSRPWGLEMRIGENGQGSLDIQDSGQVSGGSASIGTGATGHGIVTVTGGDSNWLNAGLWVAELGIGELYIEAGATVSTSYTQVGGVPGGDGAVTVTGDGSSLNNTEYLIVAGASFGSLTIADGGEVSAEWTSGIGESSGSSGTITLIGDNSNFICQEDFAVAFDGTGVFTQTGGISIIAGKLLLGFNTNSSGTYEISNGFLGADSFFVGVDGDGILQISGAAAEIEISSLLSLGPNSTLAAVPGASIHMTGSNFENLSTDEIALAGLVNLGLIFEGGDGTTDEVEVGCVDYGPISEGYINNFALGKLTIGDADAGIVQLVDYFDNGNQVGPEGYDEALYVERLELGAGSVLDLNNLHLYWRTQFVDHGGLIINGNVIQVESPGEDWWPMAHHDLSHTGYTSSSAPDTNEIAWRHTTAEGIDAGPAVKDGMVFVGTNDGDVLCFDAFSGNLFWTFTTGDDVNSTPAIVDGKVYIGSNNHSIYCLPQFDPNGDGVIDPGEVVWSYATGTSVGSSPAVHNGRVFVGSVDHNMYCLDALSGDYLWSYLTDGYVWSSPAVADGKVYFGSQDGKVYCLNELTGEFIWSYTTEMEYVEGSPSVAYGYVYIGAFDGHIYCLPQEDPNSNGVIEPGEVIWSYHTGDWVGACPAVANGRVFIGSRNDYIYCLDAFNGSVIWSYLADFAVFSSAAIADGKVYLGCNAGTVYCLDEDSGDLIWRYSTGGSVYSSPAVAADRVYVGARNDGLYAFGRPLCQVSPTSLEFGCVDVGDYQDAEFSINNTGEGLLAGYVSASCEHFEIFDGEGAYSIPPGESWIVTVRYEPASYGEHECVIETGHYSCGEVICSGLGAGYDPIVDPRHSSAEWRDLLIFEPRALVCPEGDGSWLSVNVRDQYNAPMSGVGVSAIFNADCEMCICDIEDAVTDSSGTAEYHIRAGLDVSPSVDCCVVQTTVECLGVTIPWTAASGAEVDTSEWISPDLTGDCLVDSADVGIFMTDFGGVACRADFDGSGTVSAADYAILIQHEGHTCDPVGDIEEDPFILSHIGTGMYNYPNPFNLSMHIAFTLLKPGRVVLRVFDVSGRRVRTLIDGRREAKRHEVTWDGRDDLGGVIAPGIYFYVLDTPDQVKTGKVIYLK